MALVIFDVGSLIVFLIAHHIWANHEIQEMKDLLWTRSVNTRQRFDRLERKLSNNLKVESVEASL